MCRVKAIPGATVEHNKFCVSVHFRNCAAESYDAVVQAVKNTLQEHPNLKASRGRKVLEIQPQVFTWPAMCWQWFCGYDLQASALGDIKPRRPNHR